MVDTMKGFDLDAIKGSLYGILVGDALGFPYEFRTREDLKNEHINGFAFEQHVFTDDSSLTLCTIEALVNNGFNLSKIAFLFQKWFNEGYWSPDGESTIGLGMNVAQALTKMKQMNLVNDPTRAGNTFEMSNGNGSLMRILPAVLYTMHEPIESMISKVHAVSCITHAHPRSQMACGIYALYLKDLLRTKNPQKAYKTSCELAIKIYQDMFPEEMDIFSRILNLELLKLEEKDISSSGYVLHSLEAAIWCSLQFNSFSEMVVGAVNLGDDTDTIGAITGSIAGCLYGYSSIPENWMRKIIRIEDAAQLIEQFIPILQKIK